MAKATRIAYSHRLNPSKFAALTAQAKRLGRIRSEVWQRYGSLLGVKKTDRQIRDQWLSEGRRFDVLVNPWKETLRDAVGDIRANREAAKKRVRRVLHRNVKDNKERKRLYLLLRKDEWAQDPYLKRLMRRYWRRGKNHTRNQIVVRADQYKTFELRGRAWIAVPSLVPRRRISIPLNTTMQPTGTLRLILRAGRVEVHYCVKQDVANTCGTATLGIDKGYTEVLVDSDGDHHGDGLGKLLGAESDWLKKKYQRRNKLRALAEKAGEQGDHAKALRIWQNNLGRQKMDRRQSKQRCRVRDLVFKAVHSVVDKAATIASEDLTAVIKSRHSFGPNITRRLSVWAKGCIAEALQSVSQRRCSTLVLVASAFTSQMDSRTGLLTGQRKGDRFHCNDGVVLHADQNAALNVLARMKDPEIGLYMPYREIRRILQQRTERHRLGLLNQDSSPLGRRANYLD